MNEIIKVNYEGDKQTTSARALWEFLNKPWGEFLKWFNQFKVYGFAENEDYRVIEQSLENLQGGRPATDYEITVDMAKELAMLQKTEEGKQARLYFIELEKKWNSPEALMARALKMADSKLISLQTVVEVLKLENNQKNQLIGELKPRADYTDNILKNTGLVTITQISKDYGMSGTKMNELLHELGVQYKQSEQWLLYTKHHDKGYTHSETIPIKRSDGRKDVKMNTKWTQKGRLFLYDLLKLNEVLPTIENKELN